MMQELLRPWKLVTLDAANAPASLSLFWKAGLLWAPKGSLREIAQQAVALVRWQPGRPDKGHA
ncbi:MAG: hypothetical protein JSS31_11450 [Proteobacteria bacterium]|nr:hypothetical protein [Pseudomonadota bacterium]MBS0494547.1 hypothetical protein [Pseudomonadota bacterium]